MLRWTKHDDSEPMNPGSKRAWLGFRFEFVGFWTQNMKQKHSNLNADKTLQFHVHFCEQRVVL